MAMGFGIPPLTGVVTAINRSCPQGYMLRNVAGPGEAQRLACAKTATVESEGFAGIPTSYLIWGGVGLLALVALMSAGRRR